MIWKLIIVISAAIASYFIPTPQELQNAFVSGQNFYASNNFVKAIEQYDLIINTDSDFLDEDSVKVTLFSGELTVSVVVAALYQKANALKNLEQKDAAIATFRIVEQRRYEPQLAALAQFMIYDIYYRLAQYDSAIIEANKLVQNFPNHQKAEAALYDIGWAYREINNLDSSTIAFEKLIVQYPKTEYLARAIYQMGQNKFDLKLYDEAIFYWSDLIDRFKPEAFKDQDWAQVQLKAVKERQIFEATAGRETDESVLELVAKAQIKIGDSYREKGEYDFAITNYRKIVTTYTLLTTLVEVSYIKIADYTLNEKGVEEAIEIYRDAIDENFSNKQLQAKMQYKIAETYQNNGQFVKAADQFIFYTRAYEDVANEIDFSVDKALFSAISNYYSAQEYQSAVNLADTLINNYYYTEPVPAAFFIKGLSLNELGKYTEARISFQKIINDFSESPDFVNAKVQIGISYFREKDFDNSLSSFLEVTENFAGQFDSSQVYFDLMNTYYELKRYDEAMACFDNVKFGSDYYASAFSRASKIYSLRSEYDKAIEFLNNIRETAKDSSHVYYEADLNYALADVYISKNDFYNAVNLLTKVIEDTVIGVNKYILKLQAYYGRGVISYQIGNYGTTVSDMEYLLADSEFNNRLENFIPAVKERLALGYSKTGKINEGLALINQMIEEQTDEKEKARLYSSISNIYYEAGDYRNAIASAENVLKIEGIDESTIVNSYITLSQSYKELNDIPKSVNILLEASEKYPQAEEIPLVLYSLGAVYFDSREYEKAADIFNKFITRYPEHLNVKEARYFRGYSYYESGNWSQAYNSFKQYIAAYPEDPLALETQFYAAEALFNQKEFNNAVREYRAVYTRYPNSEFAPMAMYNEGWCYFELKETEKMIDIFKRLADRYPKSDYAGDALFTIGDYYYNKKEYASAQEAYTVLIEKVPNYHKVEEAKELIYDLSQITSYLEYEEAMKLFDSKQYQKAIDALTKLYEKYPDASIAVGCQVNIAASYEMLEEYRAAAQWYRRIIERYSGSKDDNERSAVIFAKEHLEWIESNYL